jgi:superfamily II DNA or RNA helicase
MSASLQISLRDYQIPAVEALLGNRRGIVQSPAGSGKTIIGAASTYRWTVPRSRLSRRKMRVAWVANTQEQCDQARKALEAFPDIPQFADVTVCCYQAGISLASFDLVVLDECHHISAPEFRKILEFNEGWRWGLSATPKRADELANDVFTLIGPIVHIVEREALIDAGQLAKAKVFIHQPNDPNEMERAIKELSDPLYEARKRKWPYMFKNPKHDAEQKARCVWQVALKAGIAENQKRNAKIISLAKHHAKDSHLIIIGSVDHGKVLQEKIPGSIIVFSKMGQKSRRETIAGFQSGEIKTMIATSLADEGLDVPRANVLTLAASGRSAAKAEQRTGRVLRTFQDKTHGIIHDFMDVQHYFLKAQSRRRISLYQQLGYEVTFSNEGLL